MTIAESRDYVTRRTGWKIDEATFHILDQKQVCWVAVVETTHHAEEGEPEGRFVALVEGYRFFALDLPLMAELGNWCMAYTQEEEEE